MKYEWKATWKLLLSANILTVVMTGLARWMVYLMEEAPYSSDFQMVDFVAVMVLFTYVASMFAVYQQPHSGSQPSVMVSDAPFWCV